MSEYSIYIDTSALYEIKKLVDRLDHDLNKFSNTILFQLKEASKNFTSVNYQRIANEINRTTSKMNSSCENIKKLKDFLDKLTDKLRKYNYDGRFQ